MIEANEVIQELYENLWSSQSVNDSNNDGWEDPYEIDFTFQDFNEEPKKRKFSSTSYLRILAEKRGFQNGLELKRYWKAIQNGFSSYEELLQFQERKAEEYSQYKIVRLFFRTKNYQSRAYLKEAESKELRYVRRFLRLVDELHFARPYFKSERQWRNFRSKLEGFRSYTHKEVVVYGMKYKNPPSSVKLERLRKRGFKNVYEYRNFLAKRKGYSGYTAMLRSKPGYSEKERYKHEEEIYKRKGFASRKAYRDYKAQQLGYKSYYHMYMTKKK